MNSTKYKSFSNSDFSRGIRYSECLTVTLKIVTVKKCYYDFINSQIRANPLKLQLNYTETNRDGDSDDILNTK